MSDEIDALTVLAVIGSVICIALMVLVLVDFLLSLPSDYDNIVTICETYGRMTPAQCAEAAMSMIGG